MKLSPSPPKVILTPCLFLKSTYLVPYYHEIKGGIYWMLVLLGIISTRLFLPFSKKHCFPRKRNTTSKAKPFPKGRGYTVIQAHLWNTKTPVRRVLYQLASSYTVFNPVLGIVPGSPAKKQIQSADDNYVDTEIRIRHQSGWQREALVYTNEHIEGKRKRFEKYCNDEILDRIRLSRMLNHTLVNSVGFKEVRNSNTGEVKLIRKSYPRCILCFNMKQTLGEKNKAPQTAYSCYTCKVPLCQEVRDKNTYNCSQRWHMLKDIKSVRRVCTVTPASTARKKRKVDKL